MSSLKIYKNKNYKINQQLELDAKFNYMLLGRLKQDLEYYWGCGNKSIKYLYWGDYNKHIQETIKLWKSLPFKPSWFRATELIKFKNK